MADPDVADLTGASSDGGNSGGKGMRLVMHIATHAPTYHAPTYHVSHALLQPLRLISETCERYSNFLQAACRRQLAGAPPLAHQHTSKDMTGASVDSIAGAQVVSAGAEFVHFLLSLKITATRLLWLTTLHGFLSPHLLAHRL